MINVKKISKIYKSDDTPVFALRNVSLSLPSKGLVFIVGKSGSGKSTLLNMLAGFDKPNHGNIFYGDTNLKKLSATELDYYRNSVVGFVFQDYCLIETFTVKQNIEIAFDYKKEKKSNEAISEILKSVGLQGFEDRYPRQLSAGQKQRVAIARALAKDSKIILADEPTGNLDNKTTTQILDLLKEISEQRLVVVVSHSKEDALLYGERIIEISSGQIVSDCKKNDLYDNSFAIKQNTICLPNKKRLKDSELEEINELIKKEKGSVSFVKSKEKFTSHNDVYNSEHLEIKKTKMGFKNMLKYSWLFFKNQLFSFFLVVFIVTFLITTLSLSLQFGTYDGKDQYAAAISKAQDSSLVMVQDGNLEMEEDINNTTFMFRFDAKNAEKLKKEYDYKSYDLYNFYFPITGTSSTKATYTYASPGYLSVINTLLVCDNEYLFNKFKDENGVLHYKGDISSTANGIIITDIIAEALISYSSSTKLYSYEDVLNTSHFYNNLGFNVSAIIETPLSFDMYKNDLLINYFEDEIEVVDILTNDYCVAYTTNPNYYSQYVQSVKQNLVNFPVALYSLTVPDTNEKYDNKDTAIYFHGSVKSGEIFLSYSTYNALFGTNCSASNKSEFVKQNINFKVYDYQSNLYIDKTLFISSLSSSTVFSFDMREEVIGDSFFKIGEYVVDIKDKGGFYISATNNGFNIRSVRMNLVDTVVRCVGIFKDMFKLLSVIMVVSILVLIIVNTVNIMNRNIYNIGVSRSLGAHLGELGFIYSTQMFAFGVLVIIFSTITNFYSLRIINDILSENIPKVINATGIDDFVYLYFDPSLASSITGAVVFLTIVSIFIPILAIKLINPLNIIKKKS